jgi:hypothetical protein
VLVQVPSDIVAELNHAGMVASSGIFYHLLEPIGGKQITNPGSITENGFEPIPTDDGISLNLPAPALAGPVPNVSLELSGLLLRSLLLLDVEIYQLLAMFLHQLMRNLGLSFEFSE